jgi:hypothetical protein
MKKTWIWIGVVVVILIVIGYSAAQNSTFTVYPVFCQDWFTGNTPNPPAVQDFSSCHQPRAYERQTFSADTSKDEVIQTSPDTSDVHKLDSCTIQDGQHWSCGGDFSKMPGGMLAATQISRGGDNFNEYGLTNVIFVTESQWDSINKGKDSVCGTKWCEDSK